ncbi:MAG: hypothetical protein ACLT3H_01875 [Roseburia sp.]
MKICLIYSSQNETITFAAQEFCRLLTATGSAISCSHNPSDVPDNAPGTLALRLGLDKAGFTSLDDAYHILISAEGGSISGSNPRSVLLGVYACLKQIGFRFLAPGPQGTLIPGALQISDLYMDIKKTASLRHRGVCIEGANSLENILDFIDWLPKVGFNSFFVQFTEPFIFLNRWYDHTNNQVLPPQEKGDSFYQNCYRKIEAAIKMRSLLLHAVGHGWTCEAIGSPTSGWLPSQKQPKPQIAKLLTEVDGKRTFIDHIPMNTNLCYANETAAERFIEAVISYLKGHPQVDFLHIWLADEVNHICECPDCRELQKNPPPASRPFSSICLTTTPAMVYA